LLLLRSPVKAAEYTESSWPRRTAISSAVTSASIGGDWETTNVSGIDDRFAPAAAASTMFDPIRAKWLQTALNILGANPPLDVDGEYGPTTKDAVLAFQKTHELVADGWAGDLTPAALQLALSKQPTAGGRP
jgi:hypothetical protein